MTCIVMDMNTKFVDVKFKLKDLGTLNFFFLGLEVAWIDKNISVSQRQYALQLLEDSDYLGSKPVTTPIDYSKTKDHGDLANATNEVTWL